MYIKEKIIIIIFNINYIYKKFQNEIINIILKKKLVSCINIIQNIKCFYISKKKIIKEKENQIIIKTFNSKKKKIIKIIEKNHPYKIPYISTIKINSINKKYFY